MKKSNDRIKIYLELFNKNYTDTDLKYNYYINL